MTLEQFEKVKYGDTLFYGSVLVKVTGKYLLNGGGRLRAVVISEDAEFNDCDAPISCFEYINPN